MKQGYKSMAFDLTDLKHVSNYLTFAGRYLIDQWNKEGSPAMAEVIWAEIEVVSKFKKSVDEYLKLYENEKED